MALPRRNQSFQLGFAFGSGYAPSGSQTMRCRSEVRRSDRGQSPSSESSGHGEAEPRLRSGGQPVANEVFRSKEQRSCRAVPQGGELLRFSASAVVHISRTFSHEKGRSVMQRARDKLARATKEYVVDVEDCRLDTSVDIRGGAVRFS